MITGELAGKNQIQNTRAVMKIKRHGGVTGRRLVRTSQASGLVLNWQLESYGAALTSDMKAIIIGMILESML